MDEAFARSVTRIRLRSDQTLFDVTLPCLVVSNPSLGLFTCEFHLLGHKINPGRAVLLLIITIAGRLQVKFVGVGPFCLDLRSSLLTALFGHWLPPLSEKFNLRILHASRNSEQ